MQWVSAAIAVISLIVSGTTFWLAYLRRGRLRMTTPTIVFFGFDAAPVQTAKIFVRALLYSTSAQGQVLEAMHALVKHPAGEQLFTFWGYGETEKLSPGSGLYVGRTGFAANHHLVLSVHQPPFEFRAGEYAVEIYGRVVDRKAPLLLASVKLTVDAQLAIALAQGSGVLFERGPDGTYQGHGHDRNKPA